MNSTNYSETVLIQLRGILEVKATPDMKARVLHFRDQLKEHIKSHPDKVEAMMAMTLAIAELDLEYTKGGFSFHEEIHTIGETPAPNAPTTTKVQ
jgi:hypothetical protein